MIDYEPTPYDADCDPETGNPLPVPHADEWHYRAARAVLADNCDRREIKWSFERVDLEVRREIVATQAALIKAAYEAHAQAENEVLRAEIARVRQAIEAARIKISGGLCYFSAAAKQAQLRDADKVLEQALKGDA